MTVEKLQSMDGYTFDEGIAFLVSVQAPIGIINHLKAIHNKTRLHSEIHKMLRLPRTKQLLKQQNHGRTMPQPVSKSHEAEPKSNEIEPKSNENEPKLDKTEPKPVEPEPESDDTESNGPEVSRPESDEDDTDPTDIILTIQDVRKHQYTRYDQMPNDLTKQLYLKKEDLFHEMQQNHLKMRQVPKGEEHNEERAKYRAEVLRLAGEVEDYWKQIDKEIERFNSEQTQSPEVSQSQSQFNVSTYRSYICKAIRKNKLSPEQFAEVQHRVDALLAANEEMEPETIEKLKAIGITVG